MPRDMEGHYDEYRYTLANDFPMFVSIWIYIEMKSVVVRKNNRPSGRQASHVWSGQCYRVVEPLRNENKQFIEQCRCIII